MDIVLEVGGRQETVTVTTEAANLNTRRDLGQDSDQKRIEELPLLHGDPYNSSDCLRGYVYGQHEIG